MKSIYRKLLGVQLGKDIEQRTPRAFVHRMNKQDFPQRGKVLVVDDEPSYLEIASLYLGSSGFSIITASSAKEAREQLQANLDIVLVITDLKMPFEDGFTVLNFLRENLRFNHIPAIVATCRTDAAMVTMAIERGAEDYLAKPYTRDSLLARVEKALSKHNGLILLVVEDGLQRSILERDLQGAGYVTEAAEDCAGTAKLLSEKEYAAVISDLVLNDGTGFDLMLAAKEVQPTIGFVFLQDPIIKATVEEIRAAGGSGLIDTPIKNVEVLNTIRTATSK